MIAQHIQNKIDDIASDITQLEILILYKRERRRRERVYDRVRNFVRRRI